VSGVRITFLVRKTKDDNIDEYSRKGKIIIRYRNVSLYSYEKLPFLVLFLKDAILNNIMEMEYYFDHECYYEKIFNRFLGLRKSHFSH
jgi:hypothetical protein